MENQIPLIRICGRETYKSEITPSEAVRNAAGKGYDTVLVYDVSKDDEGAENAILALRDICNDTSVKVYGIVRHGRFEDIKKIIYAGCTKAVIPLDDEFDEDFAESITERFGKERLACASFSEELLINLRDELAEYYSERILIDKKAEDPSIISAVPAEGNLPETEEEEEVFEFPWSVLKKDGNGLVPCIVQDAENGEVLMLGYMNEEAYNKTLETRMMTYYSRSRGTLWQKGETSGHFQHLRSLSIDCDNDTLLARVDQIGAACHTGNRSCFYRDIIERVWTHHDQTRVFDEVYEIIKDRKIHPKKGSYTNYLFDKGIDKILKKLGEEATEIVIAAKNPDPEEVKYEIADFLYHAMVLMVERQVTWEEIRTELARR